MLLSNASKGVYSWNTVWRFCFPFSSLLSVLDSWSSLVKPFFNLFTLSWSGLFIGFNSVSHHVGAVEKLVYALSCIMGNVGCRDRISLSLLILIILLFLICHLQAILTLCVSSCKHPWMPLCPSSSKFLFPFLSFTPSIHSLCVALTVPPPSVSVLHWAVCYWGLYGHVRPSSL